MNEFLTAYLKGLYALRGGRLSSADAMNHVIDLLSGVQRTITSFARLGSFMGFRQTQLAGAAEAEPAAKGEGHA